MTWAFRIGDVEGAAPLVTAFHYSARWPANVQVCGTWHESGGLFGDYGRCIAACILSIPPTRWSEPVLELSRLVRRNDVQPALTGLIGAVCAWAKKQNGDLIVSFADPTHGHHGGIYQAASWNYAGRRERRMDGILLDGIFWSGRTCNHKWGTQSPTRLREIMPGRDIEPHFDNGKHLYWRALTKRGKAKAERLGLIAAPYPKPAREISQC